MTIDIPRVSLVIVVILQISLVMLAGLEVKKLTSQKQNEISSLYARREELMTDHQRLIQLMVQLNKTLETEIAGKESLSKRLNSVIGENDLLSKEYLAAQQAAEAAATASTMATTPPAPRKAPTPAPITRAS